MDFVEGSWNEISGIHTKHGYNSSNNSNSSSISSISSSSSDSDHKMTTGASELDGDADSLACRQSGLSSNDQLENDCNKLVLHFLQRIVFIIIFESTVIHGHKHVCQIPSWTRGLKTWLFSIIYRQGHDHMYETHLKWTLYLL
jgi:hypothetical protein